MLEKLEGLLQSGVIKGLLLAAIPLLVVLASLFGVDEAVFRSQLEGWAEKLLLILSLSAGVWAAFQRIYKPTPPLTEAAAQESLLRLQKEMDAKGQQLIVTDKNGAVIKTVGTSGPMGTVHGASVGNVPPRNRGFAHPLLLALVSAAVVIVIAGCQHTRAAYSAAESPLDLAFVVSEHYSVLREKAADLKESGSLSPEQVSQMQAIDLQIEAIVVGDPSATPARPGLLDLARTEPDARKLQAAVNAAVEQIANLSRFLKAHGVNVHGNLNDDFGVGRPSGSSTSFADKWTRPRVRLALQAG